MSNPLNPRKVMPLLWLATGLVAFVVVWQIMSNAFGPLLVATPAETTAAVAHLLTSPGALAAFWRTLGRVLLALGLQVVCGVASGVIAGLYPWVEDLLKPVLGVLVAVPPVALALLVILMFGSGDFQVAATALALGFPLLHVGTITAVRSVDRSMLEMFAAFGLPKATQLVVGYLPAILYSLLPSILLVTGLTVRLTVMVEVMVGGGSGIGQSLSAARVHLATAEIFAWLLVMATTVLMVEGTFLYLVKGHLLKWQARR